MHTTNIHTNANTHTHKHTRSVGPFRTSYQLVPQTATYTTHIKQYRRISMPSGGLEPAIAEIKELQPTPYTVWPVGLAGTYLYNIKWFLNSSSEYGRLEINTNVDTAHRYRETNICIREKKCQTQHSTQLSNVDMFVSKGNCAKLYRL
jgi:hypothetical protein